MQRMERAQQEGLAVGTANAGEFKKNADRLLHEAQLLALMGEVLKRDGDDETFSGFARQMQDAALGVAEATRQNNYDAARKAVGEINKACSNCHKEFRD
jgi:hypothetical protein